MALFERRNILNGRMMHDLTGMWLCRILSRRHRMCGRCYDGVQPIRLRSAAWANSASPWARCTSDQIVGRAQALHLAHFTGTRIESRDRITPDACHSDHRWSSTRRSIVRELLFAEQTSQTRSVRKTIFFFQNDKLTFAGHVQVTVNSSSSSVAEHSELFSSPLTFRHHRRCCCCCCCDSLSV